MTFEIGKVRRPPQRGTGVWFVTPAYQRYELSAACFAQRRHAMDFLAERGVEAHCVVVADDENRRLAKAEGFDVLSRPNYALGRRFNDGIEYAARHRADWIVPIGSDSFIDPTYLFPLPDKGVMRSSTYYAIADDARLGQLRVNGFHGVGPYMIHRNALPLTLRPAENWRRRGIDHSTLNGLRRGKWKVEKVDLHPWQYVGFRSHPQLNGYDKLYRKIGVAEEYEVVERLSEFYPLRLVERAVAACRPVEVAA